MHSLARIASRLWTALALASIAHLGALRSASADVYYDLAVESVQAIPIDGAPGSYQVDVDLLMLLDSSSVSQPVLVRIFVSGQPQSEGSLDVFAQTSGACCTTSTDCEQVAGWSVSCVGTCGRGSGGPYACAYRRRTSFLLEGILPGSSIEATVDPDGWHVETGDAGTSNNSADELAPAASFHDLALESLDLVPASQGTFSVSVGVRLVPGDDSLSLPPVVRFYRGGAAVSELSIDGGHGIGGPCCDTEAQCPATDGFSVSCENTCIGGIGGTRTCVYRLSKTIDIGPLVPGDTLSAVIDPDGWYYESSADGTTNNSVSASVPQTIAAYGTGKLNSAGCVPSVTFSGVPSASSPDAFVVGSDGILPGKKGILFYGYQQAAIPFIGGVLCVAPPVRRTGLQTASGDPAQGGCGGTFGYDFNARIQSGVDPSLVPGAYVAAQHWYRDSGDPLGFGTGLSNALWFQIGN